MVRLKCWEFPQHLQVFRNNGETGKEADKNSSGCGLGMLQLAGKWGGLKMLGRRLCWDVFFLHEAWRFGFCGFGVKLTFSEHIGDFRSQRCSSAFSSDAFRAVPCHFQ